MGEIVNKIQLSGLVQIDLASFKPKETIETIDLKHNLWQGLALKEKDFREFVKTNDWASYLGKVVGVYCSADAIIPTWAYRSEEHTSELQSRPHLVCRLLLEK